MADTITFDEFIEDLCTTLLQECKTHINFPNVDIKKIIEESKQVPHKAVCTTSFGDGESDDEDTDWRERYESTREVPYGCLDEEAMKIAIMENDLDTIDECPVLANITLGNMLREDPELEDELELQMRERLPWNSDIPKEAFAMIQWQRSLSPKRTNWKEERRVKQALLEIF